MNNALIVDDHAVVRAGLKNIVGNIPEISNVLEAESASDALKVLEKNNCNIIILDISLPDRNGLELLKDVKQSYPSTHVLMLSMYENPQYVLRSLKAGADGYITKSEAFDELQKAINKVMSGKKYISSSTAFNITLSTFDRDDKPLHENLSDREFEVFILIAEGKSLREIADILCIHSKTVSTYRARIFEKMGFSNNSEITKYALKNKLIE